MMRLESLEQTFVRLRDNLQSMANTGLLSLTLEQCAPENETQGLVKRLRSRRVSDILAMGVEGLLKERSVGEGTCFHILVILSRIVGVSLDQSTFDDEPPLIKRYRAYFDSVCDEIRYAKLPPSIVEQTVGEVAPAYGCHQLPSGLDFMRISDLIDINSSTLLEMNGMTEFGFYKICRLLEQLNASEEKCCISHSPLVSYQKPPTQVSSKPTPSVNCPEMIAVSHSEGECNPVPSAPARELPDEDREYVCDRPTEPAMTRLFHSLRRHGAVIDTEQPKSNDLISIRTSPPVPPVYADEADFRSLPADIQKALTSSGVTKLYAHQFEAIQASLSGKNVVLEAPTASGKTLSFAAPIVSHLTSDRSAHALLMYPTKSLSNDQRHQINELAKAFCSHSPVESWTFDGDTPSELRGLIKKTPPAIMITTPEMLNASFLGWANQWENFLANVKYLVIDEIHEYRGFFGGNFGLLLRRFFNKLRQYGANPQVFCATATCGNPQEHAEHLTGKQFTLVKSKVKMTPKRHYAFIRPNLPDYQYYDKFRRRICQAALACLGEGLSTLVFCPSRSFTEDVYKEAIRKSSVFGHDADRIAPYKSGYRPEQRREIEEGLQCGKYKLVFATNALELGIDIGRLDGVILAGFPDSVMSAWQRIGRAGRSWEKDAFVLYFAMNNAYDAFFAGNIDAFLGRPIEGIMASVENEELISKHTPYLLHESKWYLDESCKQTLGEPFYNHAKDISSSQRPVRSKRGPNPTHLNLRSGAGEQISARLADVAIGTMDSRQKFREAYIGAIYTHFGATYKVVAHGEGEVILEHAEPYLKSRPYFYSVVSVNDTITGLDFDGGLSIFYGKLTIFENMQRHVVIDTRTDETVDEVPSNETFRKFAHGFWIDFACGSKQGENREQGALSAEQLIRIGLPFVLACDRHDIDTFSELTDKADENAPATIYVAEGVPGGIGIAQKCFEKWEDILRCGIEIAEECSCRKGCPTCIYPPRIRSADKLDKRIGIETAKAILADAETGAKARFDPATHGWFTG